MVLTLMCICSWPVVHAGVIKRAELTLETTPIISAFLGGKSGRVPASAKRDHRHQAYLNLILHKSSDYVCHGGGARNGRSSRSAAPKCGARQESLDEIGIIVSPQHPPTNTFLAPALAEYCVTR